MDNDSQSWFWSQRVLAQILTFPPSCCVILGKSLSLSELHSTSIYEALVMCQTDSLVAETDT